MAPEGRQTGGGPNSKCYKVCDGSDGDGDAGVGQGSAQSLLHVQVLLTGAQRTTGKQNSTNLHSVSKILSYMHSIPLHIDRQDFVCSKSVNLAFKLI